MDKNAYSRRFTDLLPQGIESLRKMSLKTSSLKKYHTIASWVVTLYLLIILLVLIYPIWQLYHFSQEVIQVHTNEQKVMHYWQRVVSDHPNYPDAYFQLAKQEARLRQTERALSHLEKALLLDPQFQEAKDLQKEIMQRRRITQF